MNIFNRAIGQIPDPNASNITPLHNFPGSVSGVVARVLVLLSPQITEVDLTGLLAGWVVASEQIEIRGGRILNGVRRVQYPPNNPLL